MPDPAPAPSRGFILLSAALRRLALAFGRRRHNAFEPGADRSAWSDSTERLDLTLPAHPSSLPLVRQALRRLSRAAGLDEDRTFALQVAVGEAITNVIEHAYAAGGIPRLYARREGDVVRVSARREGAAVVVEVTDRGRWRSDRAAFEQRRRGIQLMRGLADSVDIRTTPSGTIVRLAVSSSESSAGRGSLRNLGV
jgi:anti-sigma regulatory factor (Ser/Thr protein kinase)